MSDLTVSSILQAWEKRNNQPKAQFLYRILRDGILQGHLKENRSLPASRTLAKTLSISRNTVNQVYENLISEGLAYSQMGSGVYVSLLTNDGFKQDDKGKNKKPILPKLSNRVEHLKQVARIHQRDGRSHGLFAPGQPALDHFPFDKWARLLSRRWRLSGPKLAMSEDHGGFQPLREHIAKYLSHTRGLKCSSDNIIIVSGAQQGLDLIARVLWQNGSRIGVENPCFPGILGVLAQAGCQAEFIDVDAYGANLSSLEKDVKLDSLLLTPSRNYPLGSTLSQARRQDILDYASRNNIWIVEDDFDSEFRFDGPPLSAMQGQDHEGRVIYVGTFSRIIFPSLRLGYVVVPDGLIEGFRLVKAYMDGHAPILHQVALADFFEDGLFDSHIRKMKKLYADRRQVLHNLIYQELSEFLEIVDSDGGLHLTCIARRSFDDVRFCRDIAVINITLRPLSQFYQKTRGISGLVMGFAGYDEKQMREGIRVIAKKISTY